MLGKLVAERATLPEVVDFTRPYGIFHDGILMRRGEAVPPPSGLAGKRFAAIRASAIYNLASSFTGAEVIEFESEHVCDHMLAALRTGEVDAVCDDDVVFVPLGHTDRTSNSRSSSRPTTRGALASPKIVQKPLRH